MADHIRLASAVILITLLGFLFFPGHTWLQQDSQIYAAILEHHWDPTVLANDPIAVNHHLTFTIYDELALAARRVTGLEFQPILVAGQLLFRALAILGIFLIGVSLGLSRRLALLVAAVFALGATVMGPAVLTVEYEPKPRGAATGLLFLAIGLLAQRRHRAAAVAGAAAFLLHPPTACPFWAVYLVWAARAAWKGRAAVAGDLGKREAVQPWTGLLVLAGAAVLLFAVSRYQIGGPGHSEWFARISPEAEALQKLRCSYVWVSAWIGEWLRHYLFLWAVSLLAFWRLRPEMPAPLKFFAAGLPAVGMLSLPASYLLLDLAKLSLMTQFLPARALLFVPAFAVILAAAACYRAARARQLAEALIWGLLAFAIPMTENVFTILLPDFSQPYTGRRILLAVTLSALAVAAGRLDGSARIPATLAFSIAAVLPFTLIPSYARVPTEANMHHEELDALAGWARENTPREAVFLFAGAGRGRQPGIFRVRAQRAIYVDWKAGGQVNMVDEYALEWGRRWRATMADGFTPARLDEFAQLGIDFVVLQSANCLAGRPAVYQNGRYCVYRLSAAGG